MAQRPGPAIKDAVVVLVGTSITAKTDENGQFAFPILPTNGSNPPVYQLTATAPGFGTSLVTSVPLFNRQGILLHLTLPAAGQTITSQGLPLQPPARPARLAGAEGVQAGTETVDAEAAEPPTDLMNDSPVARYGKAGLSSPLRNISSQVDPPPYIRVGVTSPANSCNNIVRVDHVDFVDYVKSSLPREWIASWDPPALQAGAMAVKEYAWYWINSGGKHASADLDDSPCDQVFEEWARATATDEAVDATFVDGFHQNGSIFQAEYIAGTAGSPNPCMPDGTCYPGRMSQWGSQYLAQQGYDYHEILNYYYSGLDFFGMAPPAPQPIMTSYVAGQSATFSFPTIGAAWYQVSQWSYVSSTWSVIAFGPDSTVTANIEPGQDSLAITVAAWNGGLGGQGDGWGWWEYNNGYTALNVQAGSWPATPSLHGADLTDQGVCLKMSDPDDRVAYYVITQWINNSWTQVGTVVRGQADGRCPPPTGFTTYLAPLSPGSRVDLQVQGYTSDGSSWSGGAVIGENTYLIGY